MGASVADAFERGFARVEGGEKGSDERRDGDAVVSGPYSRAVIGVHGDG